jgi:hypothetical protein
MHKLKESTMMKNYKTSGALSKGKKHEGDSGGGGYCDFIKSNKLYKTKTWKTRKQKSKIITDWRSSMMKYWKKRRALP